MSTKSKTALIILGTLVMGIAIGVLGIGRLQETREQRVGMMRPEQRFTGAMERIIRPREDQREAVDEALAKWSEKLTMIHEKHQDEIFAIYDSLHKDFESLLTAEQHQRLEGDLARGVDRRVEMRVARLSEDLQLTDDQTRKIEEVMERMPHRPPFGRGGQTEKPYDIRHEMRSRFEKMNAEIEAILTPEQRQKFRESKTERQPKFERSFRRSGRTSSQARGLRETQKEQNE